MSWWAWLGLVLLAWTLLGVGLSLWLGLGIGEADRRRPRRGELTPEDITDPGTSPGLRVPGEGDRRRRGGAPGWAAVGRGARMGSPLLRRKTGRDLS
ncbi:hypothetical protein [Modestobacter sp. SSW1-42]|uniref:hypothetical protein n=1 Tax=Modestobacter sp. SSW1-42 TaxID=596372 RepID=UPI003985C520